MIVGMLMFAQLSSSYASRDAVRTLAAVAKAESGFNTLAIHDNTTAASYAPTDPQAAVALAADLIAVRHHSVDLGLMQVNSANLGSLGLSIADAFDACHSIAAGARVLRDGYQHALRVAFSRYNTGDSARGFANGYVRRVELASAALPAINPPFSIVDLKPVAATAVIVPVVVLDMLHSNQVAAEPQVGPSNLLSGVVLSHAVEVSSQTMAAVPHPATDPAG